MIAADAGCFLSLIKNLELQLSLADVEELVKLIKNIANEITRDTGATTKPRNAVRKSMNKNVDQTKFGSLGNAFAILFVEVFEVGLWMRAIGRSSKLHWNALLQQNM